MNEVFAMVPAPARSLGWMALIVALLLGITLALVYVAFSARNVDFEVTREGLSLRGDFYGRTIPHRSLQLDEARVVDLREETALRPRWRTLGTGLPGYQSGWFRLRNGEKALVYLTTRDEVLYLPTEEGYALLLSAAEPERLLESLASAPR